MDFKLDFDDLSHAPNVDALLTREQSDWLAREVVSGYDTDKGTRREWESKTEEANKLALQVASPKTTPWQNASNVKFPLLTVATLQFSARAYGALVKPPEIVKCRVVGEDPQGQKRARASRVAQHMSYQMIELDPGWEEEHDKLFMTVPIVGCSFIKTYYDSTSKRNCSTHVLAQDLVLDYYARSVESAERKTHVFKLHEREIRERQLNGRYSEVELGATAAPEPTATDERQGLTPPGQEPRRQPREILEQHTWFDLDGDGYPEPYVLTVDRSAAKILNITNRFGKVMTEQSERAKQILDALTTQQLPPAQIQKLQAEVVRLKKEKPLVLKIEPIEYFTKFPFIPSPDGGIYDLGFGQLQGPINESVNTIINQLVDSGSLQNGGMGFIGRGARLPGGQLTFAPREWKRVDVAGSTLREAIVPLPIPPPSPVLFNLLTMLIGYGEKIASVNEAMLGDNPGQNTPATTSQQMLQQGMQVFSGIFKRLHRSLRDEFRKWYKLNQVYLEEADYFRVMDGPSQQVFKMDYGADPDDIAPAADANMVLSEEKLRQSAILAQRAAAVPGYNMAQVEVKLLQAMGVQDIEQIYPLDPKTGQPAIPAPSNPEVQMAAAENQRKTLESAHRYEIMTQEVRIKGLQAQIDGELKQAQTVKALAEAGAIESQVAADKAKVIMERVDLQRQALKDLLDHHATMTGHTIAQQQADQAAQAPQGVESGASV